MRQILTVFLAIALFLTVFTEHAFAGGWVDDWLQQKTVTGPSSFSGQQRGYLSGGSVQARWPTKNDYPISIEKPHLRFGCGGIDAFMGSFSFMDPEYLVAKFQRIIQNAPALAFNIAMSTLAEKVKTEISTLESQIDALNSIQLSDCAMAKKAVAYIQKPSQISEDLQNAENTVKNAIEQDVTALSEKAKSLVTDSAGKKTVPDTGAGGQLGSCPDEINSLFLTEGSVLENISKTSFYNYPPEYINIMRGFVGDVYAAKSDGQFIYKEVEGCPENANFTVENFLTGEVYQRGSLGSGSGCTKVTDVNVNLTNWVKPKLNSIVLKMKTKGYLSPDDQAFINTAPALPAYEYLKYAVVASDDKYVVDELSYKFAGFYAAELMKDMYSRVDAAYSAAKRVLNGTGERKGCNLQTISGASDKIGKVVEKVEKARYGIEKKRSEIVSSLAADKLNLDKLHESRVKKIFKKADPIIDAIRKKRRI